MVAPVALVGLTLAVVVHTVEYQTSPAYRASVKTAADSLAAVLFSKQTGGQVPTYLEHLTVDQLKALLKAARGRGKEQERRDLEKALKGRRGRNIGKARGGRREPKTAPKPKNGEDGNSFILPDYIYGFHAAGVQASPLGEAEGTETSFAEERAAVCGVGILSCPF